MTLNKSLVALCFTAGITAAFADDASTAANTGMTTVLKYPWEHSVSAGVTLTRGNSQTALFTADFTATKKTPVNEYLFGLAGAYGNNSSVDTVNNYKGSAQWNHLFNERLYGYVLGAALRDVIQNVDYRINVGPGIGYYFIKDKMTYLAGEAGLGYEAEHLNGSVVGGVNQPGKDESFATVRLADRFEHKFNDHARLWQTAEILPQIDKFDNFIVNFEIGVETSVTKSVTLKTYLDDNYQKIPAAGKLKNDIKIVAAVGYKF